MPVDSTYLNDIRRTFRNYRTMAERALAQVGDDRLQATLDAGADAGADADDNSIAIIMQHVTGNLRSRFTGFLISDGEKPDRNRDAEFETHSTDRAALLSAWNDVWEIVLRALDALTPEDLERTVHIRQQPLTVVEALNRSVTHTAYHVGQIVFLAKHHAGAHWQTISVPKRRS